MPAFAVAVLALIHKSSYRQNDQSQLNPALVFDLRQMETIWAKGVKDAEHHRKDRPFLKDFEREIGKVRTSTFRNEAVSFIHLVLPQTQCYSEGYASRKDFWPDDQVEQSKADLRAAVQRGMDHIDFSGNILISPSFTGKGYVRKRANPQELDNVHVVLKVGDHIYQPREQPGDLQRSEERISESISEVESTVSQTNGSATAYNRGGSVVGSATGTETTTNYYTVTNVQNFPVYHGRFRVRFDLFDKNGMALITPRDKELEVIVVYGDNERHAKYDLREMGRICGLK